MLLIGLLIHMTKIHVNVITQCLRQLRAHFWKVICIFLRFFLYFSIFPVVGQCFFEENDIVWLKHYPDYDVYAKEFGSKGRNRF